MNLNPRSSSTDFFVAGGTLPASAPSYVTRPADGQLLNVALAGEFCYVLTTRQMGKSSLMVRTADRLKEQGIHTAIVDLTGIGRNVEDTWYLDFLCELANKLALAQDVEAWWRTHAALSAVLRFRSFLRDVVLAEIEGPIVIFVDEIDSTLGLPFADDFFAAVRATYNERADDAQFKRLTFIFLGVAAPADLIKDRTRTPFNIGQGILLRDLDRTDATVLQQGLDAAYPGQGHAMLDRIYHWTNGHPYLTQRLCREVVDQKRAAPWTPAEVDQVVHDLFLSDQANREQNLQFVQDRVLRSPHRRELLKLYGQVHAGKTVANDEQSVLQNQLKLAGLVTTEDGQLRVHNEIYRVVFGAAWIKANTPRDNNRLMAYAAIAVAVFVIVLTGFVSFYNANVQRQSDQLQLEFTQAGTSVDRLDRLAQLFALQGILSASNFDDAARRLFFEMNSREDQLALFQVNDNRMVEVIEGIYTALADVNDSGDSDALLTAMRGALQNMGTQVVEAPRLHAEIDYWLQARQESRQNQYNAALADYGQAIQADQDDSNPATHFERARIRIGLQSPDYPQALSDLDTALAAARNVSGERPVGTEPLTTTLTPTPPNIEPTATSVVVTATPMPTALPTNSAMGGQTPVSVPTAASPRPGMELRPFRSQFISYVQIASAIRNLIDSRPKLAAFLANSAAPDYRNLRAAQLVPTLPPTPGVDETLIVVADFEDRSGGQYQDIDPAQYIYEQLTGEAKTNNLNVRIERLRQTVDDNTARPTGETAGATLVLWGWYNMRIITFRIERIKIQSDYPSVEEGKHLRLDDPVTIERAIILDLPMQTPYLTLLMLGLDKYAVNQMDEAIDFFKRTIEGTASVIEPVEAYYFRGNAYANKGDYDRAIADYDQAIRFKPGYATAYYNRGIVYAQKGDIDRAVADYDKAIQLKPDFADAYYSRGSVYKEKGDADRAIADFDQAIQLKPDYAEAYNNRGLAYIHKSDYARAIADYDKAIQLQPNYAEAYYHRGIAYQDKGDIDRAIADFDQAIQLRPNYAEAYSGRGIAYYYKGDTDRAIADYDKAIQLKPDDVEVYNYRGNAYKDKGDYDRAIADYDQAIQLKPDYAYAYNHRCYALYTLGRYPAALPDCEKAVQLMPDDPNILDSRALVYQALGRNTEAIADFKKILELSHDPVLIEHAQNQLKALGVQ
jgi:tetratricopeptide (TPR) repeat protein